MTDLHNRFTECTYKVDISIYVIVNITESN